MSVGALYFAEEVDGRCDLLDEEGDEMVAVLEEVEEEVEIVLSIQEVIHRSAED